MTNNNNVNMTYNNIIAYNCVNSRPEILDRITRIEYTERNTFLIPALSYDDNDCLNDSSARKGEKKRGEVMGEYGRICGEEKRNAGYGGMVQPSQQHVAPSITGVG